MSDNAFVAYLSAIARLAPGYDRFFVYGHMELNEYVKACGVRWSDHIFTVIRDPIDLMISQANYAIGRLRQDPSGRQPDTAEILQFLKLERLPELVSAGELKDLAIRALLDARIVRPNLHMPSSGGRRPCRCRERSEEFGRTQYRGDHNASL